jgi:hypothetical protein
LGKESVGSSCRAGQPTVSTPLNLTHEVFVFLFFQITTILKFKKVLGHPEPRLSLGKESVGSSCRAGQHTVSTQLNLTHEVFVFYFFKLKPF